MPLLPESERKHCVRYVLAFAAVAVAWAVVHDLHLIEVEPKHFTEYHRPLLPLTHLPLLALQYAVVATLGPGLLFGFMAWLAARWGSRTKANFSKTLGGFVLLLLLIEAVLLGVGAYAESRFDRDLSPIYPTSLYPDDSRGILYTQTVNISAYLIAPALGFLYLAGVFQSRRNRPSA